MVANQLRISFSPLSFFTTSEDGDAEEKVRLLCVSLPFAIVVIAYYLESLLLFYFLFVAFHC